MRFNEKVVIVTGAGRGIGRGIAKWFASGGAKVIIAEVNETLARSVLNEIRADGGECQYKTTDVSSVESVNECVSFIDNLYGRIDILVNNAAISIGDSFLDTSIEKWQKTININLTGVFIMSQSVAKYMISHSIKGKIINIASINSFAAEKNACPYVASKGGVNLLTKSMAVDLADFNIRVNAVAPGPIITEYNREYFESEPMKTGVAKGVPSGKSGVPEDIAMAVGFLASEQSQFVNGSTLTVDGGYMSYIRLD